ncbi:MAG TPA: hypothetical protein VFB41_03870 [Solirubrobacteraceae bacterium]|nr:hypothetical protein [Solirubrobacteraceae bacterium]
MSRRGIRVAIATVAASLATAFAATVTSAGETGLSGQVESTIELSIDNAANGALDVAVTATVSETALAVRANQRERTLDAYAGPVTNAHTTVKAGSGEHTITFGPTGP